MFGLFGSKSRGTPPPPQSIRDTLFGDMPLEVFPPPSAQSPQFEPWISFVNARAALAAGRGAEAIDAWHRITRMSDQESRVYAQAWHFLRAHGVTPPAELTKLLLGVVVEVPMNGGLDLLAAYPDHHARYYNYSGRAIIWEHPNDSLDPSIDALLAAGQKTLEAIGPWTEARPPAPPQGKIRLNLISPAGLHFGQGPFEVLAADPLAKPAIEAANILMQQLIAIANHGRT